MSAVSAPSEYRKRNKSHAKALDRRSPVRIEGREAMRHQEARDIRRELDDIRPTRLIILPRQSPLSIANPSSARTPGADPTRTKSTSRLLQSGVADAEEVCKCAPQPLRYNAQFKARQQPHKLLICNVCWTSTKSLLYTYSYCRISFNEQAKISISVKVIKFIKNYKIKTYSGNL